MFKQIFNLFLNVNINKGLIALGSLLIFFALIIIAATPRASGYEVAIYYAYPQYFWVIVITSFICGIIILIREAFSEEEQQSNWYLAGFALIILTNIIIITLPALRGYYISDVADEINHLGMIKDILLTGHFGDTNFYPIPHIISTQIALVTGLDERAAIKIIPSIFYLVYMAGLFLLSRQITGNKKTALCVLALGSPLLFTYFNYVFMPTHFLLFLLPFILFLFFKHLSIKKFNSAIIFYLFLLLIPFTHPLGSLFIVIILLILGMSNLVYNLYLKRAGYTSNDFSFNWNVISPPSIILFIIFFAWFSNFTFFDFNVNKIYDSLMNRGGASPMDVLIQQQGVVKFTFFELAKLIVNSYGHILLMLSLIITASGILVLKLIKKDERVSTLEIFFLLVFSLFTIFYVSTLVGNFIITGRSIRVLCWPLVAGVLLAGIVFHDIISKFLGHLKTFMLASLTVIIIVISIIGLFAVYLSPATKNTDTQATLAGMSGMEWFTQYKNPDDTLYFGPFVPRAASYIYGYDSPKPSSLGSFYSIPQLIKRNTYLISTRFDQEQKKLFPNVGVYTIEQLEGFLALPGVNQIYFNGDVNIMQVSLAVFGK
jgi:hypothetical protein